MAATMGGIDAVSFSGGVGEGSAAVRAGALAQLEYLGLAVNPGQNEAARGDANISAPGSPGGVAVVTAREDLEIAAQVSRILG
jgi:acetate kinase